MKVIRTRVGVLAASCGLLASAFGLTVITVGTAVPTLSLASVGGLATSARCPNATVIEGGRCA